MHVLASDNGDIILEACVDLAVLKATDQSLEEFIKEFLVMQGTWSEDVMIAIKKGAAEQNPVEAASNDAQLEILPEESFKPMEEPVHVFISNTGGEFLEMWVDLAVLKETNQNLEWFIKEFLTMQGLWSEDVVITIVEETVPEVETTPVDPTEVVSDMDILDMPQDEQEALFMQTAEYLPVKNAVMTAIMAVRNDNMYQHNGIDLTSDDTTVYTIMDGTVMDYGFTAAKGNYLVIDNGNGVVTEYAHLSESLVSVGDAVSAGTPVAVMGSTGMSTGTHLHWEMTVNGELVNPLQYVAEYLK